MTKIKKYDKYNCPIYDVAELERYEYGGRKKLYKLPNGGICDAKGHPLGLLDLIGLGISLEPEEPKRGIGMSDAEINQNLDNAADESVRMELKFRAECNASIRGDSGCMIDPLLGAATKRGGHWVGIIGEEKFKRIYHEQEEYFNQLPEDEEVSEKLKSIFGADYTFPVNRRGDVYFVNMIDEDTNECVQFMIRDKKIYTLQDENEDDLESSEMEELFREETESVLHVIFG